MKLLTIAITSLLLTGCMQARSFWDKEILDVYAPNTLRDREKNGLAETLNGWLGKPKNERIRIIGPPNACSGLNTGEEVCEWVTATRSVASSSQSSASSSEQHVTFTYDKSSIARSWSYRGAYGQFTNADYHLGKSTPASSKQTLSEQQTEWVHPTKVKEEFSRDYYQCQTDAQRDPKAGVMGAGSTLLLPTVIQKCMEQNGWVERQKR